MQSLASSLIPKIVMFFTIYITSFYVRFRIPRIRCFIGKIILKTLYFYDKIRPLPDLQNRTLPDWRKWDPSGLAKLGPLRIGGNGTLLDW